MNISSLGLFISFEGSEGCGKSTQVQLLTDALRQRGHSVTSIREPGGTALGERLRTVLQDPLSTLNPSAELLLFAASRAQLVAEIILPALAAGTHVIADRFVDSTTVYQGFARGLSLPWIQTLNTFATQGLLPHLTFLLDLPAPIAQERTRMRSQRNEQKGLSRIEKEPLDFYERVRQGYVQLAAQESHRIVMINAIQPVDIMAEEILERFIAQAGAIRSPAEHLRSAKGSVL